jgi:hypothetical protein
MQSQSPSPVWRRTIEISLCVPGGSSTQARFWLEWRCSHVTDLIRLTKLDCHHAMGLTRVFTAAGRAVSSLFAATVFAGLFNTDASRQVSSQRRSGAASRFGFPCAPCTGSLYSEAARRRCGGCEPFAWRRLATTSKVRSMAASTATKVSKVGLPAGDVALYRLSRVTPAFRATCVIWRAWATSRTASRNICGESARAVLR